MAGRDIFTGGACNADGSSSQVNQNPFNKFMDTVFTGNGQNKQMVQGFQNEQQGDIVEQQMMERQKQMMMMQQEWGNLEKDFKQKAVVDQKMQQMMNNEYQKEQMAYQQMQQFQHMQMQQTWKQEQMNQQAQNWADEHLMEQAYNKAEQEVQQQKNTVDEEQERIHAAANQLFDQMAQDEDPRFKNSKFLGFMGQLKTGEVKIVGKELIKNPVKEQQNLEGAWEESKKDLENNNLDFMSKAWQQAETENLDQEKDLEAFWAKRIQEYEKDQNDNEQFQAKLEEQYTQVLKQMKTEEQATEELLGDAWGKAQDLEENALYRDASDQYNFNPNNPYLNHENPFELGLQLMAQGKPAEAILALEAQIQKDPKNPQNGETWRIMGKLLQDNDQDQKAVACFLNCLKFDEKNLDTLLALGISCTNILDEVKAMNFLKNWLIHNPNYNGLQFDHNIIPSEQLNDYTTEQIKQMNASMIQLFQNAKNVNPNDPELLQSLAVLHFIQRDYEQSVILFQQALNFDKTNYSLWNKLGATLAHLGRAEEAMDAYHQALDIKPNYVRVWVNLGIAYAYKSDYQEAARFYLNALSFNPDATHIWSYLQTTFMCMQRFDLVGKITQRDVRQFSEDFEILNIDELPQPDIAYGVTSANVVLKKERQLQQQGQNWANEFKEQQK